MKYKWLGLAIALAAAVPGFIVGVLAYFDKIPIQSAHIIVLWCVGIGLIGWAWHMVVVIRQRAEKQRFETNGYK